MEEDGTKSDRDRVRWTDLLRGGKSLAKTEKLKRLANSLQWRHKYQNAEFYIIEMFDKRVINVKMIANGEINGLGTGVSVWPAAHVLSRYLEKRYTSNGLRGQRVCDIGSGTGCTGFIAAALGAHCTLTDQHQILPLLESNKLTVCKENASITEEQIDIQIYDWGRSAQHLKPPFDLIIVSDCVLPKLYPILPLIEVSKTRLN
jgi:methylase of polypeptide subunit release factors